MGEIPLMTPQGTFVINGAERVVVSASCIARPASAFESTHPSQWQGALQLPHHSGSRFVARSAVRHQRSALRLSRPPQPPPEVPRDHVPPRARLRRPTRTVIKLFYNIEKLKLSEKLDEEELATKVLIADVLDGEAHRGARLRAAHQRRRSARSSTLGHKDVKVVDITHDDTVIKALKKDPAHDEEEALKDIYRKLRPGDPPTVAERPRAAQAPLLRSEEVRSRPRRSLQDQPEARHQGRSRRAHRDRRGFHRRDQVSASACAAAKARSMTSITSAAAACARSANCSPTSAASASPAPSVWSRSA